jgi:nitroreductase
MDSALDAGTVDRLLTTTRAVRRGLDLDRPVDLAPIHHCLRLAQQAPTAENQALARWIVVTSADVRTRLGAIYARGIPAIRARAAAMPDVAARRVHDAAEWLARNLARVPVLVVPCLVVRPPTTFSAATCSTLYGSILPAVWSFQLALRSRGLGSVFTTLHLAFEGEARTALGIPDEALQVALVPVAHVRGRAFVPARRPPVEDVVFHDRWGARFEESP